MLNYTDMKMGTGSVMLALIDLVHLCVLLHRLGPSGPEASHFIHFLIVDWSHYIPSLCSTL